MTAALDEELQLLNHADDAEHPSATSRAPVAEYNAPRAATGLETDHNVERLRQLSDEVSRIASALARLSAGPSALTRQQGPVGDVPAVSAETVRTVIRARRLRASYFSEEVFADPAWDMLLELLHAEILHFRVPISSLCEAAAVPSTTALRWVKTLVEQGLFIRRADAHDGRRVFVELAPEASCAMRRYFAEVGKAVVT